MLMLLYGVSLSLIAYLIGRFLATKFPKIPMVIFTMLCMMFILWLVRWSYADYMATVKPLFMHLLGYVVVALAIPIASMNLKEFHLKKMLGVFVLATLSGALLPMGLAYLAKLSMPIILSFSTRSVTTPIAINITDIFHAPLALVSIIIVLSALIAVLCGNWLFKVIKDERAVGLALGLTAHVIGTVYAFQHSQVCGRYASFGMAINGVATALWLPFFVQWFVL